MRKSLTVSISVVGTWLAPSLTYTTCPGAMWMERIVASAVGTITSAVRGNASSSDVEMSVDLGCSIFGLFLRRFMGDMAWLKCRSSGGFNLGNLRLGDGFFSWWSKQYNEEGCNTGCGNPWPELYAMMHRLFVLLFDTLHQTVGKVFR